MTVIHIREGRVDNAKCKTLCGEFIHRAEVRDGGHKTIRKHHRVPKHWLNYLSSCTMSASLTVEDENNPNYVVLPKILPKTPTLWELERCSGCWDHPKRALHLLKQVEL